MSFWSNLLKGFGTSFGTVVLAGLVAEAKGEIDRSKKMTPEEKTAAKAGVDLLAARVTARLDK